MELTKEDFSQSTSLFLIIDRLKEFYLSINQNALSTNISQSAMPLQFSFKYYHGIYLHMSMLIPMVFLYTHQIILGTVHLPKYSQLAEINIFTIYSSFQLLSSFAFFNFYFLFWNSQPFYYHLCFFWLWQHFSSWISFSIYLKVCLMLHQYLISSNQMIKHL